MTIEDRKEQDQVHDRICDILRLRSQRDERLHSNVLYIARCHRIAAHCISDRSFELIGIRDTNLNPRNRLRLRIHSHRQRHSQQMRQLHHHLQAERMAVGSGDRLQQLRLFQRNVPSHRTGTKWSGSSVSHSSGQLAGFQDGRSQQFIVHKLQKSLLMISSLTNRHTDQALQSRHQGGPSDSHASQRTVRILSRRDRHPLGIDCECGGRRTSRSRRRSNLPPSQPWIHLPSSSGHGRDFQHQRTEPVLQANQIEVSMTTTEFVEPRVQVRKHRPQLSLLLHTRTQPAPKFWIDPIAGKTCRENEDRPNSQFARPG
jgi:hypothetical protein